MSKRGQLTIFVIIAVLIVGALGAMFFFTANSQSNTSRDEQFTNEQNNKKLDLIKDEAYDCVDSVTSDGLILIALQGGYYKKPQRTFSYNPVFFSYYYYEGQINIPSLETIQSELGNYASDEMVTCINNIDTNDFQIDYITPQTTVKIEPKNTFFQIDMLLELQRDGDKAMIDLKRYTKNYNTSLYEMYEVASFITNSHIEDPEYFCTSCISDMLQERDLFMYTHEGIVNENITAVIIYENKTGIGNPYPYVFFNKYTGTEQTPKLQSEQKNN